MYSVKLKVYGLPYNFTQDNIFNVSELTHQQTESLFLLNLLR